MSPLATADSLGGTLAVTAPTVPTRTTKERSNIASCDDHDDDGGYDSQDESDVDDDDDEISGEEESDDNRHGSNKNNKKKKKNKDKALLDQLTIKENRAVSTWKFLVLSFFVVSAAFSSIAGKGYILKRQRAAFLEQYAEIVHHVDDDTVDAVERFRRSMQHLTWWITAQGPAEHDHFPFVILRDWELMAGRALRAAVPAVQSVAWCPLIHTDKVDQWNNFVISHTKIWLRESLSILEQAAEQQAPEKETGEPAVVVPIIDLTFRPTIRTTDDGEDGSDQSPFFARWQVSPPPVNGSSINTNVVEDDGDATIHELYQAAVAARQGMFSRRRRHDSAGTDQELFLSSPSSSSSSSSQRPVLLHQPPVVTYIEPVYYDLFDTSSSLAGLVVVEVSMTALLHSMLPLGPSESVVVVLRNSCGEFDTFVIHGSNMTYLGAEDLHDPWYDNERRVIPMYRHDGNMTIAPDRPGQCFYSLHVYPTIDMESRYLDATTANAVASIIVLVFISMVIIFAVYDRAESRRNRKVVATAAKANQIVQSMFPSMVQSRLFDSEKDEEVRQSTQDKTKTTLRSIMDGGDVAHEVSNKVSKPIADLYPNTTIMFADMKGFTAWSSIRQPSDVFHLLETVYAAFDEIAKRRRIFKVETIGDCYVAVCGLPDPRKNHALLMCRFARDCLHSMRKLVMEMSDTLGPDTLELKLRIGLHSGPVTAGVLRGDRARFQLFGDTMNTASRMETTGIPDKIHLSEQTAQLLRDAGKANWMYQREDTVVAKGKGELVTFLLHERFVIAKVQNSRSSASDSMDETTNDHSDYSDSEPIKNKDRTESLIRWASDLLLYFLKRTTRREDCTLDESQIDPWLDANLTINSNIFEELSTDLVFEPILGGDLADCAKLTMPAKISEEIANFVRAIASLYDPNRFHNFEHAAHVTMSISKLISRIVSQCTFDGSDNDIVTQLSCDPLLHMACLIAGLIHDLLHPGVPNTTLIKEKAPIAEKYNGRCVAERNSLDKAWELLMEDQFREFRLALCPTKNEVLRFRKFLVHLVLATDIMDDGLRELYKSRWSKVFDPDSGDDDNVKVPPSSSTQSTLVLQHLIQASDVSHTMQHWEIYIKWNECLFAEMCESYESGRQNWNPVDSWYEGEMKFFDYYIIPLAEKLRTCGVFGACSDEYLNYARQNRAEWERRGPSVVTEMLRRMQANAILSPPPSPVKRLLFEPPDVNNAERLSEFVNSLVNLDFDEESNDDVDLFEG